jgi:hypothetical protein
VLATNRLGAALRRWGLILIGGCAWAVISAVAHPFTPSTDGLRAAVEYPFQALFAADVFKHILIGAFVFWLAYRAGSNYLQDIFESIDMRVAERFIRQAAFASRYDVIEILNGDVSERDRKSPVVQIGGPGRVRVYLENAALFEKIDGRAQVIGPTTQKSGTDLTSNGSSAPSAGSRPGSFLRTLLLQGRDRLLITGDGIILLEGFERLRRVIDLRDQIENMTVIERTRDGILVRAEDLRFIFSVRRDDQPPSLKIPYPFNPLSVEELVYSLPRQAIVPTISSQINRELSAFISDHPLGEFLAAIGWPEIVQDGQAVPDQVDPPEQPLAGGGAPPPFIPRPEISDLFYDFNQFISRARAGGVELRWIGIGTWTLPDGIIPERHVQAWRLTQENLVLGSKAACQQVFQGSEQKSSMDIFRQTPLETARQLNLADEAAEQRNMVALIHGYRRTMLAALNIFSKRNQPDSPDAERIRHSEQYLYSLVTRYLQ